ncbi:MAG: anthranilate synthase component I family protein [Actinobacteria bacterium]|nr:anthranilate synthase component I family protein [Actinomycetota bacterium]NDE50329.1 anthranilate synthase component I family protein [Actinomycetota bacterium]NDF43042.1 anthranilate synthase component I family protein [Actinomycetota bacterium]
MGNHLASELVEVSSDLESLRRPGFWVVLGSFEGKWRLARFAKVEQQDFPKVELSWSPISDDAWQSTFDKSTYCSYVERIREKISAGEVYQVNACRILSADNKSNPSLLPLAEKIVDENPAKFAAYLNFGDIQVASASPERFISLQDGVAISSPIKGTSATDEFLEKDRAENLMIVDLIRNDLSKVAKTGSVTTPRLLATEAHPGLFHLVSDVRAELSDGKDLVDLLLAMSPPGSVSGAPKSSALKIIEENETPRGPYCGVLGFSDGNRAELAVGIRIFWQEEDQILHFGTGAGITWGSDSELEWDETELKARKLIGLTRQ